MEEILFFIINKYHKENGSELLMLHSVYMLTLGSLKVAVYKGQVHFHLQIY